MVRIGVVVFPGIELRHRHESTRLRRRRRRAGRAVARVGRPRRRGRRSSCPAASPTATTSGPGVIARFSPVMRAVAAFAADGGLVLGICNGFQVLTEAGLVPGALLRNRSLRFVVATDRHRPGAARHARSPARSAERRPLRMPVAHGEGCYFADEATLDALEARGRVLFRYVRRRRHAPAGEDDRANPNGSLRAIAGVTNAAGNVAGLMPHPETRRRGGPRLGRRAGDHPLARRERGAARVRRRAGAGRGRARTMTAPRCDAGRRRRAMAPPDRGAAPPPTRRHRRGARRRSAIELGRDPNDLELAMFSVMWSEHCSYKSSKPLLRTLPTAGDGVVAGPGENAGVISIGDGLAVAFKIESHNHPSAVEPYQGAATGVGGILRDIFTMGARPDRRPRRAPLRRPGRAADAPPRRRRRPRRRRLRQLRRRADGRRRARLRPVLRRATRSSTSWRSGSSRSACSPSPGPRARATSSSSSARRPGATGSAARPSSPRRRSATDDPSKRPTVQVGDPFAEKLLIEASLELIERGLVEGLQDLGAGGITCATSETADRAGTGMLVDLDAIPRREPGMAPFEVMISESQERMLAVVRPERWEAVREVCDRWGLPVAIIGRVTDDGDITVVSGGLDAGRPTEPGRGELARIPAAALTSDAIVHDRLAAPPPRRRPAPAPGAVAADADGLPERGMDPGAVLLALLGTANLVEPALGLRAVRRQRPGEHGRGPGPRRGGPPGQGHHARRSSRRPTATRPSASSIPGSARR